jgi:cell volume regulation protein A
VHDLVHCGWILFAVGLALTLAVIGARLTLILRVPAPALFLLGAAIASDLAPGLQYALPFRDVARLAAVALIVIVADGGARIGWRRFRAAGIPIVLLGVLGTFATAAAMTLAAVSAGRPRP